MKNLFNGGPATAISVVALVFAVGGGSATAAALITGSQIKDSSITGDDIRDKSLTGKDIKNGSVRAADLASDARPKPGPAGPAGAPGPQGPAGVAGPAGGMAAVVTVDSVKRSIAPGGLAEMTAACPAGTVVVGTGFYASVGDIMFVKSYGTFVGGVVGNFTNIVISDLHVQALCARSAGVAATRAASTRGASQAARRSFAQDVAAARESLTR